MLFCCFQTSCNLGCHGVTGFVRVWRRRRQWQRRGTRHAPARTLLHGNLSRAAGPSSSFIIPPLTAQSCSLSSYYQLSRALCSIHPSIYPSRPASVQPKWEAEVRIVFSTSHKPSDANSNPKVALITSTVSSFALSWCVVLFVSFRLIYVSFKLCFCFRLLQKI